MKSIFCAITGLLAMQALLTPDLVSGQELRGHGGPVRSISVSQDGASAITGSFDTTAIEWDLPANAARSIFRAHEGPVNAGLALGPGDYATGGDDGRVIFWRTGKSEPVRVLDQSNPVSSLAVDSSGTSLASGGWDGDIRVYSLTGTAAPETLKGHAGQVNAVIYFSDGTLVSGGSDATIRFWQKARSLRSVSIEAPVNKLAVASSGLIAACGDGHLRWLTAAGDVSGDMEISQFPVVSLAVNNTGDLAVAGTINGGVILLDPLKRTIVHEKQSRGWPVWALAFAPDGKRFFSGGGDGLIRIWSSSTGEPLGPQTSDPQEAIPPSLRQTKGAEIFKSCAACHALRNEGMPRAGPSLQGVLGRRIASVPGYRYSEAFKALQFVWTRETISMLFEVGPHAYTPGTKMPEQRLSAADCAALVDFLEAAAR